MLLPCRNTIAVNFHKIESNRFLLSRSAHFVQFVKNRRDICFEEPELVSSGLTWEVVSSGTSTGLVGGGAGGLPGGAQQTSREARARRGGRGTAAGEAEASKVDPAAWIRGAGPGEQGRRGCLQKRRRWTRAVVVSSGRCWTRDRIATRDLGRGGGYRWWGGRFRCRAGADGGGVRGRVPA